MTEILLYGMMAFIFAGLSFFILIGLYYGVTTIYDDIKERMNQRGVRK